MRLLGELVPPQRHAQLQRPLLGRDGIQEHPKGSVTPRAAVLAVGDGRGGYRHCEIQQMLIKRDVLQ